MKIYLCIPTLTRYDLLIKTLASAEAGEVKPDKYIILDNGGKLDPIVHIPDECKSKTKFYRATRNAGVAKSWNFFLDSCSNPNERTIIANDDVEFFPDTLKLLLNDYNTQYISFPGGSPSANSFSCFLIPDKVFRSVGGFDENISPEYAYFEDNDYHYRMKLLGFDIRPVENCRLNHVGSATIRVANQATINEHHIRFRLAERNYIRKWGGSPGKELYITPFNKHDNTT